MQTLEATAIGDELEEQVERRLKFAHFPYLKRAVHATRDSNGDGIRILDVGCGPGNIPAYCRVPRGGVWVGVDLWEHQLRQAQEKGVYRHLCQANLVDGLPLKDATFDLIICSEVLMYLPNSSQMIADFHRILKEGGRVLIYNPICLTPLMARKVKRWARGIYHESGSICFDTRNDWRKARRPSRVTYYSLGSLRTAVEQADFEIIDVAAFRFSRNRLRLLKWLEDFGWYRDLVRGLVSRFPSLASDIMIAARKNRPTYAPARADSHSRE